MVGAETRLRQAYGVASSMIFIKDTARTRQRAATAAVAGNGLYAYGSGSVFPTGTYNSTNYWVDVVFNQSS
jgi:Domain of unknown function (DUF4082)